MNQQENHLIPPVSFFIFNLTLAFLFTLLLTAPAYLFFSDHIIGYPHDGFEYIWKMWWYQLVYLGESGGVSLISTQFLDYPYSFTNPAISAVPVINCLAFPLLGLFSPLQTYNLILLSGIILGWLTAAWLGYYFTGNHLASSVGGAVFVFHTNNIAHAVGGHLAQTFVFLMPLAVIAVFEGFRRKRWRWIGLSGVLFALVALIDHKLASLYVFPFLGLFGFYFTLENGFYRKIEFWARLSALIALVVLLVLPFYLPLLSGAADGELSYYKQPGAVKHSADILGFFTPSPEHPLYRHLKGLYAFTSNLASAGWHENVFYLGWGLLILVLIAIRMNWQQSYMRFWLFIFLSSLVLALGPFLKVAKHVMPIPLPFWLLSKLPLYEWARTPGRFITLAMLAGSVLAVMGTEKIFAAIRNKLYKLFTLLMILSVVLLDSIYIWPMPLSPASVPPFYTELAQSDLSAPILDYPLTDYRCMRQQMYYATEHQQPMGTGLVNRRDPLMDVYSQEILAELKNMDDATRATIAEHGYTYFIVHKTCAIAEDVSIIQGEINAQKWPVFYEDELIIVFDLSD